MVVEGVTCAGQATVGRLAYAVWVEAPAPLRLARGLDRDRAFPDAEQLWRHWIPDGTRDRADIIVDTERGGGETASPRGPD